MKVNLTPVADKIKFSNEFFDMSLCYFFLQTMLTKNPLTVKLVVIFEYLKLLQYYIFNQIFNIDFTKTCYF